MKKSPLKLVLILGMISITGALITQIFWLRKALQVKESNFDQTVLLSLRRVSERIDYAASNPITVINPVSKISARRFRVEFLDKVDCNILDYYLRTELAYPSLDIDFEYAIHESETDSMLFHQHVDMQQPDQLYLIRSELPTFIGSGFYTEVYFPTRSAYIGVKMTIWIFSFVVLIIAVFFFAYTILVILRQMRLVQMQKDFINNMAHEFKTPISSISISADTLASPEIIYHPERLKAYANIIKTENQRLGNQVDKLLQMAKMERDKVELHLEAIDLHSLIKEVVPNFSLKLEESEGILMYQLDATHHIIEADRVHLTNIIYNLLDNAVKYTDSSPVIELSTRNENEFLLFSVRDNGSGIPAEYIEKVFDKFFRVPTGNIHNVKGFGLGLHYLKLIVNAHKWKINVVSEEGKGSTFTISIPFTRSELLHEQIQTTHSVS